MGTSALRREPIGRTLKYLNWAISRLEASLSTDVIRTVFDRPRLDAQTELQYTGAFVNI